MGFLDDMLDEGMAETRQRMEAEGLSYEEARHQPYHVLLACRIDKGVRTALAQGWREVARNRFERPDGERVRICSDARTLTGLLPSVTIYLGYNWQFAYTDGRPVSHFIDDHRIRGGQVIDLTL